MNSLKSAKDASFSDSASIVDFKLELQIEAMKAEHKAFHELMALLPKEIKDEAIALWVRGTSSASDEAYFRRAQKAELSEFEYNKNQDIAHEAWKAMIKEQAK